MFRRPFHLREGSWQALLHFIEKREAKKYIIFLLTEVRAPLTDLEQMQEGGLAFSVGLISRYHHLHRLSHPAEQAPKGQWGQPGTDGADMHTSHVLRSFSLLFSRLTADFYCFLGQVYLDHAKIWDEFLMCGMLPFSCWKARVALMLKIWGTEKFFLHSTRL